ncbi:hypothetical protein BDZ89DRAFT_1100996 [Hymenopellis radicata]|nr:hypothetical protein BDZ89DRAFT_1100996 [Hymenopellis radicata]
MASSTSLKTICEGCNKPFDSILGYNRHIRSTHNPACHAIFEEAQAYLPGQSSTSTPSSPVSEPELMVDPSGDAFGDYDQYQDTEWVPQTNSPEQPPTSPQSTPNELEEEAEAYLCEHGWEPPAANDSDEEDTDVLSPAFQGDDTIISSNPPSPIDMISGDNDRTRGHRNFTGEHTASDDADKSSNEEYLDKLQAEDNQFFPFRTEMDWLVANWAKCRGPSSTSFTELLAIPGVIDKLGLSYRSANELNTIIDKKLPSRPAFHCQEVVVDGEVYELYFRNIMECVEALYSDPDLAAYMKFSPEKHYFELQFEGEETRAYHDMYTGNWWWSRQEYLDAVAPGGTLIPIIISSDKTQITVFRNKSAYPVYMTIGNIPKEIRRKPSMRAYVLLGYLPTSRLETITNKSARRHMLANLFHACLGHITEPLKDAAEMGVVLASGDGMRRRTHPIFAAYIGDYPEQVLVTCSTTGRCPKCVIRRKDIGKDTTAREMKDLNAALTALAALDDGEAAFVDACKEAGIKPIFHPFWECLPLSNVYLAITPDMLHQLYQGVFKHLKRWVIDAYGPGKLTRVRDGISSLSRVTGVEHNQMSSILLGLIVDLPLPGYNAATRQKLIRAVESMLDFLYLAQYPVHSEKTLDLLEAALDRFHANKDVFVTLGIREHFQIPKLHSLNHYIESIRLLGTFDNFNTEYTERLHIDLAKDAYRATNRKDEYPQMTTWLERKEAILRHGQFVRWRQENEEADDGGGQNDGQTNREVPVLAASAHVSAFFSDRFLDKRVLQMAKHPSVRKVPLEKLQDVHGATFFLPALARFTAQLRDPSLSGQRLEDAAHDVDLSSVTRVATYHRVKYSRVDPLRRDSTIVDSLHIQPARRDKRRRLIPGRFDTALVQASLNASLADGLKGYRIAQVRLVFTLTPGMMKRVFNGIPRSDWPTHMAYVCWFTAFGCPDPDSSLYSVSRCETDGGYIASVVDVRLIERSVHLFPRFGRVAPRAWTSSNVLEKCKSFYLNSYSDRHMYKLLRRLSNT